MQGFMQWPLAMDAKAALDDPPQFPGRPSPPQRVDRSLIPPGQTSRQQNVAPAAEADDEPPVDPRDPEHVWICAALCELLRTSVAEGDLPQAVYDQVRQKLIQLPNKLAAMKRNGSPGKSDLREGDPDDPDGAHGMVAMDAARLAASLNLPRVLVGFEQTRFR